MRLFALPCMILLALSVVAQNEPQVTQPSPVDALGKALDELQSDLPRWRGIVAAVDVESMPIQYKEGKQVEFLKSVSLDQLDKAEKLAGSLKKKITVKELVELLLSLKEADSSTFG